MWTFMIMLSNIEKYLFWNFSARKLRRILLMGLNTLIQNLNKWKRENACTFSSIIIIKLIMACKLMHLLNPNLLKMVGLDFRYGHSCIIAIIFFFTLWQVLAVSFCALCNLSVTHFIWWSFALCVRAFC